MQVPVYNTQGSQVGTLDINEATLGGELNYALLKQAYVRYHANLRQGSARTRNRAQVEGSTKKLYKQKGTGNARHGDRKVNLMKGGGHGHSKKRVREDYRKDMPKKMRRKANRNALLAKLIDNEVRVIDRLELGQPKTRDLVALLRAVRAETKTLVAAPVGQTNLRLAARNVEGVTLTKPDSLNAFDLLNHRYLVIDRGELESWLAGPSSQTGKDAKINPLGAAPAAAGTEA
ncbi:MAG: 50S ribosomal protein L4 [Planctomyces sp.]|nr:50S ribosomal protein L4 [Planctomyces sp.]